MIFEISDNMRALIAKTLGSRGSRGPKSPHTADVVFIAAAQMASSKQAWRSFDIAIAGGRHSAARRVKAWVEGGSLERLKNAVQASGLKQGEIQRMLDMIDLVVELPGRPRSVEGKKWVQRRPRKVGNKSLNASKSH